MISCVRITNTRTEIMKIGLIDVDNHAKKKKWGATIYPNLSLCKISAYHKSKGDEVEWAVPLEHYDIIYKSKIFNFTPDDDRMYFADEIVKGGTGYDVNKVLPPYIDDMQPDYSIYPTIPENTSYGFLTRGCPNKCAWCVVPRKEGAIRPYWDIDRVANGNMNVVLMDNNILAAGDYCMDQLQKIVDRGYKVDFNQALDARLVNEDNAKLLGKIKWLNYMRFGCDTHAQIKDCERAMELVTKYGYHKEYLLYTMVGGKMRPGETEFEWNKRLFRESYERVTHWRDELYIYKKHLGGGLQRLSTCTTFP